MADAAKIIHELATTLFGSAPGIHRDRRFGD
jgi:hypothetical protein